MMTQRSLLREFEHKRRNPFLRFVAPLSSGPCRQNAGAHLLRAIFLFLMLGMAGASAADFDKKVEQFDQQLFDLRKTSRISGLAAGIVKEGKLVWSGFYGFADADQTVPVTADTPYWIASVTKTFVGLLFLQLEEEGKVVRAEARTTGSSCLLIISSSEYQYGYLQSLELER